MNVTFRQLRVFVQLFELRSFTASAHALHMTQSAVSKLCSELEAEVGFPLFDRSTRHVEPTDGASDLYAYAVELLGTLDSATRSLSDLSSTRKGNVGIAAAPMVFYGLLCDVMTGYQRQYPHVRLETYEVSTDMAIDHVVNGRVDFGLVALDRDEPRLLIEAVYHDALCLACPPLHHLLEDGHPVKWERLAREKLIMLRSDNNLGRTVGLIMRRYDADFRAPVEVGAVSTMLGLVRAGAGIGVVSKYISRCADSFGIRIVPIAHSADTLRTLSLIRRRNARSSIAAAKFIEIMRAHLQRSE
jgi:DNA-binding transcriptional LysR family regulator